jgi:DNA polymerase elongation subunit (family B)
MYQSIFYNRQPGDDQYHYYLRDDKKGISCFQYWPTLYKLDEEGEFETLFGDRCSPIQGRYDRKDPTILEKDIDRELVLLRDLYYKTDDRPSYHNIVYLDIEIEILGALTPHTIREANAEITAIALIDVSTKEKICFILDKEGKMEEANINGKIVIPCSSEKQLLSKFLKKWEQMDPTIVVGYNSDFFDIPYLYYRIRKIMGDEVLRLSPIKKIEENINNGNSPIKIGLVNSLDYMLLLKKYIMKEESSYKLGDIGLKYAKLGKIEYNGSLDKLFVEDKEKYVDYNIRDVEIIEALEEKQKFIELTVLISHLCHTPYESIYYNTTLNEGAILTYLKRKNIVAPNKPTTTNPTIRELEVGDHIIHQRGTSTIEGHIYSFEDEKIAIVKTLSNKFIHRTVKSIRKKDSYAGGYLLDPIPGLYSDVSDLDFTSLYPSIIKSLNLGVETLMGRIVTKNNYEQHNSLEQLKQRDPEEKIHIQKLDKYSYILKDAHITIGNLIKLIENNKWTISASGAFFRTDTKSIACEVLGDWFDKRNHYKWLKKKAGKSEDWENYKLYDLYQMAFKILQNALYGTYAINSWRFTDGFKICSSAITNSGQRLTKESIEFANQYISKQLGIEPKKFIIASDTDSLYMYLTDLLLHRNPDLNYNDRDEKIKRLLILTDELQKVSNDNLNQISQNLFNIIEGHHFELKQEVIAEKAYWSGKRRYAMYIVNKEGVEIEELEMKGLDIMKSNFPPYFREFGEELIKSILFSKPKEEIDKFVMGFKDSIYKVDWKKLLKPVGLKKLDEYIERKPTTGEIFSKLKLKCPINTKSAIISNDILRFKGLTKQYPEFTIGDKIYIAALKPNPYKIEVVALNGYNDAPEILEMVDKYIDRDGLFDSIIRNKLHTVYSDIGWELNLNPYKMQFFSYL